MDFNQNPFGQQPAFGNFQFQPQQGFNAGVNAPNAAQLQQQLAAQNAKKNMPQFKILLVGDGGVGKTSMCNSCYKFNVN